MGPLAQATAAAAGKQRAALSCLPLLQQLGETLPAMHATELAVTVLQEDASHNVSVGVFELPQLDSAVQDFPKSESYMCALLWPESSFQMLVYFTYWCTLDTHS